MPKKDEEISVSASFLPDQPSDKRNEPGGRTIKMILLENNQLVFYRAATLTSINQGGVARYTTDDGDVITAPDSASRRAVYQRLFDKF